MGKRSNVIKENISQFILIVFSVVLGLYLSERIEERKKKQDSDELLATIEFEVKDNIKLLEYWVPYHEEINKKLDSLSKNAVFIEEFVNDKTILYNKLLTRSTFIGRFPASDAWDIAKSHPLVVNIDYNKLLILSRIYNQQEITFEPMQKMFDLLNSKNVNEEKDAKSNLAIISSRVRELVAREKQLMHYYEKAEGILDLEEKKDETS